MGNNLTKALLFAIYCTTTSLFASITTSVFTPYVVVTVLYFAVRVRSHRLIAFPNAAGTIYLSLSLSAVETLALQEAGSRHLLVHIFLSEEADSFLHGHGRALPFRFPEKYNNMRDEP